jgi:hypothetical protein
VTSLFDKLGAGARFRWGWIIAGARAGMCRATPPALHPTLDFALVRLVCVGVVIVMMRGNAALWDGGD